MANAADSEIDIAFGNYQDPQSIPRVLMAYMPGLIYRGLGGSAMKALLSCKTTQELDEQLDLLETFGGAANVMVHRRTRMVRDGEDEDMQSLVEYVLEHYPPKQV